MPEQDHASLRGGAGAPSVIDAFILGDFDGFAMGNIYRLDNGQIWEQYEAYIWPYVAVMPAVTIWGSHGIYRMKVEGIEYAVGVRLLYAPGLEQAASSSESEGSLRGVIESRIVSRFEGFEMGNIYKLANGQIWEQYEAYIWRYVAVMPAVTIWGSYGIYRMKVEGIEHAVGVRLLYLPGERNGDAASFDAREQAADAEGATAGADQPSASPPLRKRETVGSALPAAGRRADLLPLARGLRSAFLNPHT